MPTYATLLDMAKRNGRDRAVPLIQETSRLIPEISGTTEEGTKLPGVGSVRTIKGINYSTLVRVTNPTVAFRDANEGVNSSVSQYINRLVETFILNPRWEADKAVADRSEDVSSVHRKQENIRKRRDSSGAASVSLSRSNSKSRYACGIDCRAERRDRDEVVVGPRRGTTANGRLDMTPLPKRGSFSFGGRS